MHLSLPIEVLQERCRIYMEVRMIPRCVRIENFDIQASVELDCDKFAALDYCRKEMNPQCADIVDVWGKDGKVMVVWQQPHRDKPLFYIVNFGVAQSTIRGD
ncbi:Protein Y39H10A.4 [Aphelenchoides avenae]|nr:Protein Y39H10A.4 [Aphelenchus avenae]KAH7730005.1 Protein Y39H10A.4 [Aphelenchus avenae]